MMKTKRFDLTKLFLMHKLDHVEISKISNCSNKVFNMTTVTVGKATSLIDGPLHNHIWEILDARRNRDQTITTL